MTTSNKIALSALILSVIGGTFTLGLIIGKSQETCIEQATQLAAQEYKVVQLQKEAIANQAVFSKKDEMIQELRIELDLLSKEDSNSPCNEFPDKMPVDNCEVKPSGELCEQGCCYINKYDDINNDGKQDLFLIDSGGIAIYIQNINCQWPNTPSNKVAWTDGYIYHMYSPSLYDIDNDQLKDVVYRGESIYFYKGLGNGNFERTRTTL